MLVVFEYELYTPRAHFRKGALSLRPHYYYLVVGYAMLCLCLD